MRQSSSQVVFSATARSGVAQLVSAYPSELDVPSSILGDFYVCSE